MDVLYQGVTGAITITDTGKKTKTTLEQKGFADSCVWSPFGNEDMGFDKFVCVEPVQSSSLTIAPKSKSTFFMKVSCVKI